MILGFASASTFLRSLTSRKKLILVMVLLCAPTDLWARKREPDHVTLSGFYSRYNLRSSLDASIQWPAQSADVELAVRLFSIVSFVGSLANSIEPPAGEAGASPYRFRTIGAGFKIDIPGFFFFGAERKDFRGWTKSYPLNLFFLGEALSLEKRDVFTHGTETVPANQFGFGLDLFPFVDYSHFTLRAMAFNYSASTYVVTSVGGGVTF